MTMPRVTVAVDVDLENMCHVEDLKLVVRYAMLASDEKIRNAAEGLNEDLWLKIKPGDESCPKCDEAYRKWRDEDRPRDG